MNRRRFIWMLVVALCLVAVGLALWLPRYAAAQRVSDLYRRYAGNPHLTVAYIEDFRVNDTVAVDVTTFSALDAEGWDTLCSDFNVPELPDFIQEKINNGNDMVIIRHVTKGNPSLQLKESESVINDVASISILNRTVSIFHTETEAEQLAVNSHQFGLGFED